MGRRGYLLVVDDDADVRTALAETLGESGYQVTCAVDGAEALEVLLQREPPALIVLDLRMPNRSGWQLLDTLRGSVTLVNIPVIVVSAFLELPPAGAVSWLKKPVKREVLLREVRRHTFSSRS